MKKSFKIELLVYVIFLLGLMVSDAIDHPEDFWEGYNTIVSVEK